MITYDLMGQSFILYFGRQGEKNARTLTFDMYGLRAKYGNGTLTLALKRPGDSNPFPVAVDVSGNTAIWTVSNIETDIVGEGEAQFTYTVDGMIKKTVIYKTKVDPSLTPLSETAPEAFNNWLDELSAIGGQVVIDKAEALDAIADSRSGTLSDITDARTNAVNDVSTAKSDALGEISTALSESLLDISDARTAAVNAVHEEAVAASGYANDASGYANNASRSAEVALASEQAASGYADEARSYAENLHFTESSSGNIVISIGGGD